MSDLQETNPDFEEVKGQARSLSIRHGIGHVVVGDENLGYYTMTYIRWHYSSEGDYLVRFDDEGVEMEAGN